MATRSPLASQTQKTMRHFTCVDTLWSLFEEMACEFDCSVDYLLNEAMRLYARSKQRGVSPAPGVRPPRVAERKPSSPTPRPMPPPIPRPTAPRPTSPVPRPTSPIPRPTTPVPRPTTPRPATVESGGRTLVLLFNQQQIAIVKETFVIGRKQAGCDLVIRDGNISRRHAAIIRRNGSYYLKDLGSTNGVSFRGARVESKRIDDGDLFQICDYELRFTYRA
jgi:pSer/pThr/pTyr-binding forkhead associated (FHA) protein